MGKLAHTNKHTAIHTYSHDSYQVVLLFVVVPVEHDAPLAELRHLPDVVLTSFELLFQQRNVFTLHTEGTLFRTPSGLRTLGSYESYFYEVTRTVLIHLCWM